ncbi:hypothetical protein D5278_20590 [bacterium 1XD21-13]|nr:hypothetical protein [bacterium 1XD21-13]
MTNLISGGLSYALMSADCSAKAALKPMNMVSRELEKQNPDWELVERAGKYGRKELDQAEEALVKAQKELKESQKKAKQDEKAEMETRLKEKAAEKTSEEKVQADEKNVKNNIASNKDFDIVEIDKIITPTVQGKGDKNLFIADSLEESVLEKENYVPEMFKNSISQNRIDLKV